MNSLLKFLYEYYGYSSRPGVEVEIVETGEIFDSIKACADAIGATPSNVSRVVNDVDGYLTCKGFHIVKRYDVGVHNKKVDNRGRPGKGVIIIETNEFFDSAEDAAKHIGGSASTIREILSGKTKRKTHKGFHFRRQ